MPEEKAPGWRPCDDVPEAELVLQDGTTDYRKKPACKSKTGGWKSVALILGTELCERLATLGIGLNLITYLVNEMHISPSKAPNIVTNFLGTSYLCCLLGGFIADTLLGRYGTIVTFASVQLMGTLLLTCSASFAVLRPPKCYAQDFTTCSPARGLELAILYLALYSTALGTGGIKACVSAFGADQFDENDKRERLNLSHFFNWFVVAISTGALLAVTVLIYVQDNIGRSWGYGISAAAMLTAIIVFLAGTRLYRYKPLDGSSLISIARVLVAAFRKRRLKHPADASNLYEQPSKIRLPRSNGFRFLDKAAILDTGKSGPWRLCGVTQVEQVKTVFRILPICATSALVYTVFAQMTTVAIMQGTTMEHRLGPHFNFSPGSLGVFMQLSVMLGTVLYDQVLLPLVKLFQKNKQGITILQRIGTGMVFSCLAMVTAALVERRRLATAEHYHLLDKPKATIPMSIFWLVPQYSLVGLSEVFTYIGQLEFFYSQSPEAMRSMGTGLFMSTVSVGFFVSSFLVSLINKLTANGPFGGWISSNVNRSRLDNFYWLLAALSLVNLTIHVILARWYKYKAPATVTAEERC